PHMRGDNHLPGYMLDGRGGSPPHAWGQSISSAWSVVSVRFTPTCVGTIARPSPNIKAMAVHPHMRGDNDEEALGDNLSVGSPPHAWGQLQRRTLMRASTRFTPTCVGTMKGAACAMRARSVHPHMRGDNPSMI